MPPAAEEASYTVTAKPRPARSSARVSPDGPAPITATFLAPGEGFFSGEGKFARLDHFHLFIRGEPFQQSYGNRRIDRIAGAGSFTGMGTYPSAYSGERVSLPDQVYCLDILLFLDELDITLDIDIGRALRLARRMSSFRIPNIWSA